MTLSVEPHPSSAVPKAPSASPSSPTSPALQYASVSPGQTGARHGWNWTPPRPSEVAAAASPFLAVLIAWAVHAFLPNHQTSLPTRLYPRVLAGAALFTFVLLLAHLLVPPLRRRYRPKAPLLAALVLAVAGWELITLKLALMPLPYFPGPGAVLDRLVGEWRMLLDCTWHSLLLLSSGYLLGSAVGVVCGVLIGWSSSFRYWGMPLLKLVGPIPATAFVPLALLLFPTATVSGISLIALAVWFPLTMLTASGIANVRVSYLDVARTLGAGRGFLIFRVALPAAAPSIFVGLFMGLGASFLTLIVAETVGVRSGLGWYLAWAQQWTEYDKVYAVLVIMAVFFSGIMTLLFALRDRVLVWQKGVIKW